MKTIRLKISGKPRESMSFPGFDYMEIVNEDWEDSSFFEKLEHKFLLVIFREDEDGVDRLFKVAYWNMPYEDRMEAKRVWEETKKRVSIDARNLPKMSESTVAHVRPKARDGQDKLLTPQGDMQVKKCFWLNSGYIARVVAKI
jgi:DNA mismatch repair protein MutH